MKNENFLHNYDNTLNDAKINDNCKPNIALSKTRES